MLYCTHSTTTRKNFPFSGFFDPDWLGFNGLMTNNLQNQEREYAKSTGVYKPSGESVRPLEQAIGINFP